MNAVRRETGQHGTDCSVLAGCIHRLKQEDHALFFGGVELRLQLVHLRVVLLHLRQSFCLVTAKRSLFR